MATITVYRTWTVWQNEGDDEPTKVREESDSYDCVPDSVDREGGLTVVDLAVHTLERKLYVTETSAYPWQPGAWYSASGEADEYEMRYYGADSWEVTAHLEGFNADEERAIFRDLSKRNGHWG